MQPAGKFPQKFPRWGMSFPPQHDQNDEPRPHGWGVFLCLTVGQPLRRILCPSRAISREEDKRMEELLEIEYAKFAESVMARHSASCTAGTSLARPAPIVNVASPLLKDSKARTST